MKKIRENIYYNENKNNIKNNANNETIIPCSDYTEYISKCIIA